MRRIAVLGLSVLALFSSPVASYACEGLAEGPRGKVTEIVDGDTVILDSGTVVRLIGTQAPKLPLGREGFPTWPKAEEAKQALGNLLLGREVRLAFGGEREDRYGRALAHVFTLEDDAWAQQQMVASGFARVYSFPDNRSCLDELLAEEVRARTNRLGIWSDPYYSVRSANRPESLAGKTGHYELVEGRVLMADEAGGRIYLNFGRKWKEDFTAVIDSRARKLFSRDGLDPLRLEGALVRVRGWVDDRDGPRIEVTHPEQIEVLASQ